MEKMEGTNEQLQTKYQKIATEYSKIRAQANVLKKAVIDEQTRSTELQEQLKEKEVEIRRSEQELDSLTFRNQQLTKRVTVLQEELDEVQNRGSGKKTRSQKSSEKKNSSLQLPNIPNHIIDEEFQKKILENAQLVSQLSDKESEIILLNERIDGLEITLDKMEKNKNDLENKYRNDLMKFHKERDELQRIIKEKDIVKDNNSHSSSMKLNGEKDAVNKSSNSQNRNPDSAFNSDFKQSGSSSPTSSPQRNLGAKKAEARVTEKCILSQEDSNAEFEIARLFELEKELSFWKAEYNILKIKFDQLKEAENTGNGIMQIEGPVETTNMLGRLASPFSIPEEIEARETKVKEYYKKQIDDLISQKHIYHIKNFAIAADTQIMSIHLETSENKRQKCEEALRELKMSFAALKEDHETQEGNYKAQLSTISEHLANMNDKLISQTEEIQQLKFELGNKNAKKGKQK